MKKLFRRVVIVASLLFAFLILLISVMRVAEVKYSFNKKLVDSKDLRGFSDYKITYQLVYPGSVLPDHPLWYFKATRDKVWLFLTSNKTKKANLNILFADKRLMSAYLLFQKQKYELGYSTLTKALKYFEEAAKQEVELRERGETTVDLTLRLTNASLKYQEILVKINNIAPDDAKPNLVLLENKLELIFEEKSKVLKSYNINPPHQSVCELIKLLTDIIKPL